MTTLEKIKGIKSCDKCQNGIVVFEGTKIFCEHLGEESISSLWSYLSSFCPKSRF